MDEARQILPVHQRVASPQNDLDRPSIKLELSEALLATGVTILQQIPTAQDVTPIKKEYFLMHDWVYRIAVKILEALYNDDIYGGCLVAKRNDQDLRRMPRAVSINTSQPVNDELDGGHWILQFSGQNLRWESIGNMQCSSVLAKEFQRRSCIQMC